MIRINLPLADHPMWVHTANNSNGGSSCTFSSKHVYLAQSLFVHHLSCLKFSLNLLSSKKKTKGENDSIMMLKLHECEPYVIYGIGAIHPASSPVQGCQLTFPTTSMPAVQCCQLTFPTTSMPARSPVQCCQPTPL